MKDLRDLVMRHARGRKTEMPIPRVVVMKGEERTARLPGLCEPMICLILQGAKCILIGDQALHYDVASYFISSIDVPSTAQIAAACKENPHLSITLKFDTAIISEVLLNMPDVPDTMEPSAGFGISAVTPELLDAWLRLMRLVDTPADIPVMAPLLEREIIYRLLQGPRGGLLRQIATAGSRVSQIRQATLWIHSHLAEAFEVEKLAEQAGMSASAFHRHFKAITAMSPIQYQKRLRLHEARLQLISGARDGAQIAFSVGYESATQFNREYARMYGIPPARDAARLRTLDSSEPRPLADVA